MAFRMFGSGDADKRLSAALEAYQRDYASRIKNPENMDAHKAAALVAEAKAIIDKSGLGSALAPTLLEHIKYWPFWSKQDDFQIWVGFPATNIIAAREENSIKKEVTGVLFTYKGERYGVRFTDGGSTYMPDGELIYSGEIDFVTKGETVLGLNVSYYAKELAQWRWNNVYAFKVGPWTKHLLEIAAHIEESSKVRLKKFHEGDILERAKNIKL